MREPDIKDKEKTATEAARDGERRQRAQVLARYLLPLVTAVLLLVLGAFYNVFSAQNGLSTQISVLQLWFHTLKTARTYLLDGSLAASMRNFYLFLVIAAVLVLLLFLVAVFFAAFAAYSLYRVAAARAAGDSEAEKNAKILFRAFLPSRLRLAVTNALVLPLALFPEIFSFICRRFLTVGGGDALYIRLNVTALAVGLLTLASIALAVYTKRFERAVGLDLFAIDAEQNADGKDDKGGDEEDDDQDGEEDGEPEEV